ncbi:hypothetical protein [Marinicella litoralis]|uniref:hypothetical protein n=1 Tax=Marinicella litoralis TaxID=644220 RepID=UPI00105CE830|nr:hypothetical protein [Marinicella litoralis]
MKKIKIGTIFGSLVGSSTAAAHGGLSSLEGLWVIYLVLVLIGCLLVVMGLFWLWLTYLYWTQARARFFRIKTYLFLSIAMTLVAGFSAFTFHANAPYSQNVYFSLVTVVVIVTSLWTVIGQYKRT